MSRWCGRGVFTEDVLRSDLDIPNVRMQAENFYVRNRREIIDSLDETPEVSW